MSPENDPLSSYYEDEKNNKESDPLEKYYEEPSSFFSDPNYRDVVSENIRAAGYEPDFSEELERATEHGMAETYRGLLSGASAGLTELVPGLKTGDNIASLTGEAIGMVAPLSLLAKVFNNPLTKLAAKSPVLQKQLTSLARLTGVGLTGGIYGAVSEAAKEKKMPTVDDFVEHGATWFLLDAGLNAAGAVGRFGKSLIKKAEQVKKPRWKVVNDTINTMREEGVDFTNNERVTAKALSLLEEGTIEKTTSKYEEQFQKGFKDLSERKVEQKVFDKLEKSTLPEPYFPGEFEPVEVIKESVESQLKTDIEDFYKRPATNKQFGENIKADIEKGMKKTEEKYVPAYELSKEASKYVNIIPTEFSENAGEMLIKLEKLSTKPEGFSKVISTIETALKDAGFVINKNEQGIIERIVSSQEVSADKMIELSQRLNKIVKYDQIDKSVKDLIKPLIQNLKNDVKTALYVKNEGAYDLFIEAEKEFQRSANIFGNDSIRKIRKSKTPEKIADFIKEPTMIQDLKVALSPKQFREVEGEIIQHLENSSEKNAKEIYRELKPYLSSEAKDLSERVLESKIPAKEPSMKNALRAKTKETVIKDLTKASLTGERPEIALKLWKTKEGQQLIKQALKDNPNKSKVLKYLSEQSFKDMAESVLKPNGTIDFEKFNNFIKDPATLENIRMLGGEEAVNFFKNLETLSNRINKNIEMIERQIGKGTAKERAQIEKSMKELGKDRFRRIKEKNISKDNASYMKMFDEYLSTYGIKTKGLLALMGVSKFGIPGVLEGAAVYELLNKLSKNKSIQKALKEAASTSHNPKHLIHAFEIINKTID